MDKGNAFGYIASKIREFVKPHVASLQRQRLVLGLTKSMTNFILTVRRVEVPDRRRNVEGGDVYAGVCRKANASVDDTPQR